MNRFGHFIYFDVGNTLVDCSTAFETAALKFNLTIENIGRVFDDNNEQITKGQITPKQLWEKCIKAYNIHNAQSYDFLESWVADYKPIQEMHNVIHKIKSRYKIGLLSNIYAGMLPLLLKKELIPNIHYEEIIFSCDVGMRKPEENIYELAQKKVRVEPGNILMVDDRKDFLLGAKKARWQTFWFNNKQRLKSTEELEEYLQYF